MRTPSARICRFFVQGYGAHRHRHSFPTRRSSDLPARSEIHRRRLRRLRQLQMADGRLDRKSTRLNSSHVAISYAVFCLKEKTERVLVPPDDPEVLAVRIDAQEVAVTLGHHEILPL